jgi:hypothetical protein
MPRRKRRGIGGPVVIPSISRVDATVPHRLLHHRSDLHEWLRPP